MRWADVERSLMKCLTRKVAPLKPKHIQVITAATWQHEIEISDIVRVISAALRTRDNYWVVVFKGLIVTHILLREGDTKRLSTFLSLSPASLNVAGFRDKADYVWGQEQTKNIRAYSAYLEERVATFKRFGNIDLVKEKDLIISRFKQGQLKKEFLEMVKNVQKLIEKLLDCSFYLEEIDNVITLQAFRLLIADMLSLFHILNEGVIRILAGYFEMMKSDATAALQIYKQFAQQTTKTVKFFEVARRLQAVLGIEIPDLKHAPVSLASALEEYLKSPDFEAQREAYLERKKNKSNGESVEKAQKGRSPSPERVTDLKREKTNAESPQVDFFASLDQEISALSSVSQNAASSNVSSFNQWATTDFSANPFLMQLQQQQLLQFQQQQQQQQQLLNHQQQLQNQMQGLSLGINSGLSQTYGISRVSTLQTVAPTPSLGLGQFGTLPLSANPSVQTNPFSSYSQNTASQIPLLPTHNPFAANSSGFSSSISSPMQFPAQINVNPPSQNPFPGQSLPSNLQLPATGAARDFTVDNVFGNQSIFPNSVPLISSSTAQDSLALNQNFNPNSSPFIQQQQLVSAAQQGSPNFVLASAPPTFPAQLSSNAPAQPIAANNPFAGISTVQGQKPNPFAM